MKLLLRITSFALSFLFVFVALPPRVCAQESAQNVSVDPEIRKLFENDIPKSDLLLLRDKSKYSEDLAEFISGDTAGLLFIRCYVCPGVVAVNLKSFADKKTADAQAEGSRYYFIPLSDGSVCRAVISPESETVEKAGSYFGYDFSYVYGISSEEMICGKIRRVKDIALFLPFGESLILIIKTNDGNFIRAISGGKKIDLPAKDFGKEALALNHAFFNNFGLNDNAVDGSYAESALYYSLAEVAPFAVQVRSESVERQPLRGVIYGAVSAAALLLLVSGGVILSRRLKSKRAPAQPEKGEPV